METTEDLLIRIEALESQVETIYKKGTDPAINICRDCNKIQTDFQNIVAVHRVGHCHKCMEAEE